VDEERPLSIPCRVYFFDNPSLTDLTIPFGNLQVDIVTNLKFFYEDLLGLDSSTWTVRQPICPQQVSGQSLALLVAFMAGQSTVEVGKRRSNSLVVGPASGLPLMETLLFTFLFSLEPVSSSFKIAAIKSW
jgi:hypothetical protein